MTSALPCCIALCLAFVTSSAHADAARIVGAEAMRRGDAWTIMVTLRHADTGWEDYADAWRLETPDGRVLAIRKLSHPHVDEQPFTRSRSGIEIPDDIDHLVVRASTLPEGWGHHTFSLTLPGHGLASN